MITSTTTVQLNTNRYERWAFATKDELSDIHTAGRRRGRSGDGHKPAVLYNANDVY